MGIFDHNKEDHTDRYFPGQDKREEILLYTRLHPIVLLPHIVGFVISVILFPMLVLALKSFITESDSLTFSTLFLLLFTGYAYYSHRFFMRVFRYYLSIVVLTNFRIIQFQKSVFFINNKDTIDLHKIQDLKKNQHGLLSTLLNYGTLTVEVSAIHENKRLDYIPYPERWFQALNEAKRKYIDGRRREGIVPIRDGVETNISHSHLSPITL